MTTGDVRTGDIARGIDAFGADFARWPDRSLAAEAREMVLADPALRARFDTARVLDRGLDRLGTAIDGEIAASGAAERLLQTVLVGLPRRGLSRARVAVAAALVVLAAGLGSVFELGYFAAESPLQVVVVDPLVFGPLAGEDR